MLNFNKYLPAAAIFIALAPYAANAAASNTPSQKAPYYQTGNSASVVAANSKGRPGENQVAANSKGRPGENQFAGNSKGRPAENSPVEIT